MFAHGTKYPPVPALSGGVRTAQVVRARLLSTRPGHVAAFQPIASWSGQPVFLLCASRRCLAMPTRACSSWHDEGFPMHARPLLLASLLSALLLCQSTSTRRVSRAARAAAHRLADLPLALSQPLAPPCISPLPARGRQLHLRRTQHGGSRWTAERLRCPPLGLAFLVIPHRGSLHRHYLFGD